MYSLQIIHEENTYISDAALVNVINIKTQRWQIKVDVILVSNWTGRFQLFYNVSLAQRFQQAKSITKPTVQMSWSHLCDIDWNEPNAAANLSLVPFNCLLWVPPPNAPVKGNDEANELASEPNSPCTQSGTVYMKTGISALCKYLHINHWACPLPTIYCWLHKCSFKIFGILPGLTGFPVNRGATNVAGNSFRRRIRLNGMQFMRLTNIWHNI